MARPNLNFRTAPINSIVPHRPRARFSTGSSYVYSKLGCWIFVVNLPNFRCGWGHGTTGLSVVVFNISQKWLRLRYTVKHICIFYAVRARWVTTYPHHLSRNTNSKLWSFFLFMKIHLSKMNCMTKRYIQDSRTTALTILFRSILVPKPRKVL